MQPCVCEFPFVEMCKLRNSILKRQGGDQSSLFICYSLHFANGVLTYMFVFNIFCGPFVVDDLCSGRMYGFRKCAGNDLDKHSIEAHIFTHLQFAFSFAWSCASNCFWCNADLLFTSIMITHDNNHELGGSYSFLGALVTNIENTASSQINVTGQDFSFNMLNAWVLMSS